jgi:hypothetical protein
MMSQGAAELAKSRFTAVALPVVPVNTDFVSWPRAPAGKDASMGSAPRMLEQGAPPGT